MQGVLPHEEGGGESDTLIVTSDSEQGGISSQDIKGMVEKIF